ncbi:MAG TPA: hypothetical protein VD815_04785 [Candidatus Saccharimonadales bacterium]|nr:hypothetical protein [Candidatus Saccharimonadales bacterium]
MKNQITISITMLLILTISPLTMAFASTSSSANDDDFLNIREATIDVTDSEEMRAFLETHGQIPTDGDGGAFGYGVLTTEGLDAVVVSTTHAGVLDSEEQTDADDPVWHNHFVTLTQDSANCGNDPKVESITFESPGQIDVNDNTADITQIPTSYSGTDALTGDDLTIEPGNDVEDVVSFKLSPQFNNDDELEAVCVTDIQSAENIVFDDENGSQNGDNSNSNDENNASQGIGQSQSNNQ